MEKAIKNKIIIGTGVVIGGLIVYKIIYTQMQKNKAASVVDTSGSSSGTKGLNFYTLSDDLFNAMTGYGYNSSTVITTLSKLNNDDDLKSLYNAYGTRTLDSGFLNVFQSNFTGDLYQSLQNQLNPSDLAQVNSMFAQKGITTKL